MGMRKGTCTKCGKKYKKTGALPLLSVAMAPMSGGLSLLFAPLGLLNDTCPECSPPAEYSDGL